LPGEEAAVDIVGFSADRSDDSQNTISAMSSGFPVSPNGTLARISGLCRAIISLIISVLM